ncbi:olfactomedin-like protein 1 [Conger conger]|uniref:olfactomedin-like protein 1 n=1 Tax=Conger conger TaxID=82655 RepID=UPI002A5990B3|nr:olfactomedin-like protein 1 [Conger conger]
MLVSAVTVMRTWRLLWTLLLLKQGVSYSQRMTQEMVMMQYLEGRISQLEDRLSKCDLSVQNYEQKLYDFSKDLRGKLGGLQAFQNEVRGQMEGVLSRVGRVERELEYLEAEKLNQPCVDIEDTLLEQQVQEEQRKQKDQLDLGRDCDTVLSGVKSLKIVKREGEAQGSWMKDPTNGSAKIYFFSGVKNSTLLEFSSMKAFAGANATQTARRVQLPFPWQGTGHAVYRGFLYYHRAGSANEVLKVSLRHRTVSDRALLPGAGRLPAYSLSPHTYLDLSVDELGLWAVHADPDLGGNLVLTKLDEGALGAEHTWDTPCPSRDAETAFLVCGTLHVVYNSPHGGRSSVQCLYDIHDSLHAGDTPLFFPKSYAAHASMRYHPKDRQLYSWDEGYQTIYKLETKKKGQMAPV